MKNVLLAVFAFFAVSMMSAPEAAAQRIVGASIPMNLHVGQEIDIIIVDGNHGDSVELEITDENGEGFIKRADFDGNGEAKIKFKIPHGANWRDILFSIDDSTWLDDVHRYVDQSV